MNKKQKDSDPTQNVHLKRAGLAKIKIIGVGGGGGNAISRMADELKLKGIELIAVNTDMQDLEYCKADKKIHIGQNITKGLGAGMNADLGQQAAEESKTELVQALQGADLVFVVAGLGGGTGSGASPIVAEIAKENGALIIGIVTKPFGFEGQQRMKIAQDALARLKDKVDTLIVIPNDRLLGTIQKDTTLIKAFEIADSIIKSAVVGLSDLISLPGLINIDFADIKSIMLNGGAALIGIGSASGQDRALKAVNQAINSPLLEYSIDGAKSVLFAVSAGKDLRALEINEVGKVIGEKIDPSAKVIFGTYIDKRLPKGELKMTLIATGFNGVILKDQSPMPSLFENKRPIENKIPENINDKTQEDSFHTPAFMRKRQK